MEKAIDMVIRLRFNLEHRTLSERTRARMEHNLAVWVMIIDGGPEWVAYLV